MKYAFLLSQRFPLAGVLLAAVSGSLLASWLGAAWSLALAITGLALLLSPFWKQGGLILAFTVVVFAILQLWSWHDNPARKLALWLEAHPRDVAVQGIVIAEAKMSRSGIAIFPLRVEKISPLSSPDLVITIPVKVQVRWAGALPVYGDRLTFQSAASRPMPPRNPGGFNYRYWLERHEIYTEFVVDPAEPGKIIAHGLGNPIMAWAISARHRMEAILQTDLEGAPRELSAIKGITLGVTENAPDGFIDDFRFTGTMHLFAVSGLHVGMLAVMIWFVLIMIRLPRPWAIGLIIPLLFFYVTVTGLKSGSIRSAFMISLLLCGSALYRRSPPINTLAAAALLQLGLDPNALFSAGWQFSYSVVFAILLVAPFFEQRLCGIYEPDPFLPPRLLTRLERWRFTAWSHGAGLLAVSLAAWIGSLIPTIAYFHLISFSAIVANLFAVPLAFGVLALGALALLTGGVVPWIAGAFNNANWLVTKLLLLVVQTSALLSGGHWFVGPPTKSYPVVTILDLGGVSCAVVQRDGEIALINAGRRRDATRDILPFLESQGANEIKSLLITKPDASHLGGVSEIDHTIAVKQLLIVPEKNRSLVANNTLTAFDKKTTLLKVDAFVPLLGGGDVTVMMLADEGRKDDLGMLLRSVGGKILFLPRLTPQSSAYLLAHIPAAALHCNVMILPLGGAEIRSTLEFIRKVSPRVLVSPVDRGLRNGIPSNEWNELLRKEAVEFLRQDETGAVTIEADPKGMKVLPFVSERDHAELDRSGSR